MGIQLGLFDNLTSSLEERPASPSVLPESAEDSRTQGVSSCMRFLNLWRVRGLESLSGKTSPVYCLRVRDEILEPLSGRWGTWGMGGPIESWTLNGSESPSGAVACSLSDVLEPMSAVLERCYLSPKACAGILRRAEKRGKTIPAPLETALRAACSLPE